MSSWPRSLRLLALEEELCQRRLKIRPRGGAKDCHLGWWSELGVRLGVGDAVREFFGGSGQRSALTRQARDLQIIVFSYRQKAFRDLGGRSLDIGPAD